MYSYGVDLVLAGHVHNIERSWPMRQNSPLVNGSHPNLDPYRDSPAPVYIVSGAVGNAEERDVFADPFHNWTAWRSSAWGYSHMTIHNGTHLEFDSQSDNLGGDIVDRIMMSKASACTFGDKCAPRDLAPLSSERRLGFRSVGDAFPGDH